MISQCNLRCKHCFFDNNETLYNSQNDLDTNDILNLADELIDGLGVVALSITGGEILLKKDIFKILEHIKNKNTAVSLQTNGILLDENKTKKLADILNPNTDFVQVSLDGSNEKIYNAIRGMGYFDKALNAIKNLLNAGLKVNVNTTLLTINQHDILDIYNLCNHMGISKYSVSKFLPYNERQQNLCADIENIVSQFSNIINTQKNSNSTFFEMGFRFFDFIANDTLCKHTDNYLNRKQPNKSMPVDVSCHRHNTLHITPNGEVYLCFACEDKKHTLGQYPKSTMSNIWENRHENIFFKPRLTTNMYCKKCKYFSYCKGGCMGYAYAKHNDIYAADGYCKYAELLQKN